MASYLQWCAKRLDELGNGIQKYNWPMISRHYPTGKKLKSCLLMSLSWRCFSCQDRGTPAWWCWVTSSKYPRPSNQLFSFFYSKDANVLSVKGVIHIKQSYDSMIYCDPEIKTCSHRVNFAIVHYPWAEAHLPQNNCILILVHHLLYEIKLYYCH